MPATSRPIWIDLDNTPHVPLFRPIIEALRAQRREVVVTARDAFQVVELARKLGVECQIVGRHQGKNPWRKVAGYLTRGLQLLPFALHHRPCLAVSHGARSQIMAATLLRIPTVEIMDYEFAATPPLARPDWEIVPEALVRRGFKHRARRKVLSYQGIKEDVYAAGFVPDAAILAELDLHEASLVVVIRPPATEAHYHHADAEQLLVACIDHVLGHPGAKIVMLPRNRAQETSLREQYPAWFSAGRVVIPAGPVDGLNLLWHADLCISGGGTMNREATALRVPAYSIFRGTLGAVDADLQARSLLTLVQTPAEVSATILLRKRNRASTPSDSSRPALADIVRHILSAELKVEC